MNVRMMICFNSALEGFDVAERLVLKMLPVFENSKILSGALRSLYVSTDNMIKFFLMKEAFGGRISISRNSRKNIETFFVKIAPRYFDKRQIYIVKKVLGLWKRQKFSPVEFARKDKLVIYEKGEYSIIDLEDIQELIEGMRTALDVMRRNI